MRTGIHKKKPGMASTTGKVFATAALVFGLAGPAVAAGTSAVSIGAVILAAGNCRFDNSGPTALAFGAIDPSSAVNATASATIGYRCNGGPAMHTWIVTSDDGLYETGAGAPRMRHAVDVTKFLKYSINAPLSATVPRNTNLTMTIIGTVQVADFQNMVAGSYADTVVLTIAP